MLRNLAFWRWLMVGAVLPFAAVKTVGSDDLLAPSNLLAWCIVPYDAMNRTPSERMAMLKRLGFEQYVWDWRQKHLATLPDEIAAAKAGGIRMRGVWLWLDERTDRVGALGETTRAIIAQTKATGTAMEYWVGFNENVFTGLDDATAVKKGAAIVRELRDAVGPNGTICLYNHGGWPGEPEHQLDIIRAAGPERVGLVYNLHHAKGQFARLDQLLPLMLPYLKAFNLNGVRVGAESEIVTIGDGTGERGVIKLLRAKGYRGPIGILGHTEGEDVEGVLRRNLDGLRRIAAGN